MQSIAVYVERGTKRAFACALEWPGWCRSGRDEESALVALHEAAPRYASALGRTLGFKAPRDVSAYEVLERLRGDATTDFGAPGATPRADLRPLSDADVKRTSAVLRAVWRAFDRAAESARGKRLATGPRGGGRTLDAVIEHVAEAEALYLGGLGWKVPPKPRTARHLRAAVLAGLAASARGEIPARGPRGGTRWKPRKFARRLAWHALDHAWEIEDRSRR